MATIETAWRDLTAALEGEVVFPGSPRYEEVSQAADPALPRRAPAGRGAVPDPRGRGRGDRVRASLGYRGRGTERRARLRWALVWTRDGAGSHADAFPGGLGRPGHRGARLPAR